MSDISDLESRISAAMDRIGRGLETLSAPVEAPAPDNDALEAAQAALGGEREANAQLEERVKALNEKVEALEADLAEARASVEQAAEAREASETALSEARAETEAANQAKQSAEEALAAAEASAAEAVAAAEAAPTLDLDQNRDAVRDLGRRLRRLRRSSKDLRGSNQQLREAAEKQIPDANLINQSLLAELNDLKALRAAELVEMDLITAAMRPMLGEAANAADEGDS